MRRLLWAIAALALVPSLAAAAPRTLYVKCGTLVFDADQPPIGPAAVVIVDGTITQVGAGVAKPAGAEELDLSAYTVIPALIDAHTHLWTGPRGQQVSDQLAALRAATAMDYALRSGVAAVRVVGSGDFIDVALGRAIDEGTIDGPHVIPAGHALSIPGGHGDFLPFPPEMRLEGYYTPLHGFVNSPADAEQAVHLQIKYGAKVIKMLASGGVGSPLDSPAAEQISPEEMRVAVEQAHMAHVKATAHAENLKTILDALHAGVDSIDHGSDLDQEAVDYMKAHGVYLIPTLHIVDTILGAEASSGMPDYMRRKGKALAATHVPSFKLALASGVKMAAGNDGSYEPGSATVLDEMVTDVKYGMTPRQALAAGTKGGADCIGLDGLGTIAKGREGDLVAVEGNPLADIAALKRVKAVVYQGRVVVAPK